MDFRSNKYKYKCLVYFDNIHIIQMFYKNSKIFSNSSIVLGL